MADYQRIVEFLRDIRQAGGGGAGGSGGGGGSGAGVAFTNISQELAQMAAEYAALCTTANERLRQCSTFLQQGLRSEAIHLAEESPNLLDLVASLDLPEPAAWAELCQNNGLAVPPALQMDRAAQLNDAYAQEQPLEHLLGRHRLLALARAPVRERLAVLRQIAQTDGVNGNWEKDIRVFERARLRELPTAFYNAVKNRDDQAIAGLMNEVHQQTWYEPMPADLSAGVADAYGRMQRVAVEGELRKLIAPLRDAYAARSPQECEALVQRWKNLMAGAGVVNISPELVDEIKPVIGFIHEQAQREEQVRRFNESCKAFTRLLDIDAGDAELEAGYAKLKEFKEEIPEEITRRYGAKKASRRRDVDRQHKRRLFTIGAAALGAVAIVVTVLLLLSRSWAARDWANKIHTALGEHTGPGLARAREYADELHKNHPALLNDGDVAAAIRDMDYQQMAFARDNDDLQTILSKLERARQLAATAVGKESSFAEISAAGAALQDAVTEARAAGQLGWVDADHRVGTALAGVQEILAALRGRITAAVQGEMNTISAALEAIPADPGTPETAMVARNQIAALNDRINAVRGAPLLDEDTNGEISKLAQRIVERRQAADTSGGVAAELQNIRSHADSVENLKTALDVFVHHFPNDAHSRDFTVALERLAMAGDLEAWQQLAATFGGKFAPTSLDFAQKRLDAVNAYLAAHPASPVAGGVIQYAEYLRRGIDALADKGTWQTAFAELISSPLLTDLTFMQVSDGRRYYTLGDIKRIERKMNNQVSVTFDTLDLKDMTKRESITIEPPLTVTQLPVPTPHARVVNELADSLKLINDTNWDTFGIDLADRLVRNEQMDMVVKAMLLHQTLKAENAVAGWTLGDTYANAIADLGRQNPDQLPWLDPAHISEGTRKAIKQAVEEIPSANNVRQSLLTAETSLFRSLSLDVAGTGVLLRDEHGAWVAAARTVPFSGNLLWTIVPISAPAAGPAMSPASAATASATTVAASAPSSAATPVARLLLVGTVGAGRFVLDDAALRGVPQGSIVYITRPAP